MNHWSGFEREVTETQSTKYVLISADVVALNYGFARSIGMLSGLGHRVFIRFDNLPEDAEQRREVVSEFLKAYRLDEFARPEVGVVIPVFGDNTSVRRQMQTTAGVDYRLTKDNLISISFGDETEETAARLKQQFPDYTHLVLHRNLLGLGRNNRADSPVALLGALILEDPDRIRDLGEEVVGEKGSIWFMRQTPAAFDPSASLAREIGNYHAIRERLRAAA
ncbi:MAG: hypothetical protein Q8R76_03255 [Candidatus Omnitrophota bacterium]|nr:hypothetical protein [Candidatus Omnitrophota bacterium]